MEAPPSYTPRAVLTVATAKLCCFFAILWTYVFFFFIGLMLIYMAIGGYTPAAI